MMIDGPAELGARITEHPTEFPATEALRCPKKGCRSVLARLVTVDGRAVLHVPVTSPTARRESAGGWFVDGIVGSTGDGREVWSAWCPKCRTRRQYNVIRQAGRVHLDAIGGGGSELWAWHRRMGYDRPDHRTQRG